jgi:hypothetical protein
VPNIVPGARWAPIDVGNRAARRKGRGLVLHVAVSGATDLRPSLPPSTRPSDWHFYLPKDPLPTGERFWQYIDLDVQCWSDSWGNGTLPAAESHGGLGTAEQVNAEPWTANQIEAAATIYAYLHQTEGAPLQVMPNSLAGSTGLACHRFGIDPWRVAGGESWTSSRGKLCPGDAKVAQLPAVLARAVELIGAPPAPVPPSPPPVIPPAPGLPPWTLPRGHYYGLITGPANSHGGYYVTERAAIQAIQRRLIAKGYVPGVRDWRSGWADGIFQQPTVDAVARFQRAEMPGTTFFGQVWSDDYARLAR